MNSRYAVSFVLNVHHPFVRECPSNMRRIRKLPTKNDLHENTEHEGILINGEYYCEDMDLSPETAEESLFFEALSETYIPLINLF